MSTLFSLRFTAPWRCFKPGQEFMFRQGLNLMVGEQGCGKSSILQAIQLFSEGKLDKAKLIRGEGFPKSRLKYYSFDFEKTNPRTQGYYTDNIRFEIASQFASHGQSNRQILKMIGGEQGVCLADEPDMALSPRSALWLRKKFLSLAAGAHVIAAVHNPWVIEGVPEVLSVEHGRWMSSAEFLESHRKDQP